MFVYFGKCILCVFFLSATNVFYVNSFHLHAFPQGSDTVEGIMLYPPKIEKIDYWTVTAFKKMKNLRILIVRNAIFSSGPSYLPNSLRLIDWKGYPSKSFPPDFYPHRIVDFKLPHSSLIFRKPFQVHTFAFSLYPPEACGKTVMI